MVNRSIAFAHEVTRSIDRLTFAKRAEIGYALAEVDDEDLDSLDSVERRSLGPLHLAVGYQDWRRSGLEEEASVKGSIPELPAKSPSI